MQHESTNLTIQAAAAASAANSTPTAGSAVNANDVVIMGPKGKAQSAQVTDFASISGKNTVAIARTSLTTFQDTFTSGLKSVVGSDGSVFVPNPTASGTLVISKFLSNGTLSGTVTLTIGAYNTKLALLPGGNIAVAAGTQFAVIDQQLNVIAAPASGPSGGSVVGALDIVALPVSSGLATGGFAIVASATTSLNLGIYNVTGGTVFASTSIQTWSGTTGNVFVRSVLLSSGDIGIAAVSNYTSTKGLYLGVYTVAGAATSAMAQVDSTTPGAILQMPSLVAVPGYFHVASPAGGKVYVRTNAGAAQTNYSLATPATTSIARWAHIVSDQTSTVTCIYWTTTTGTFGIYQTDLTGVAKQNRTLATGDTSANYNFDTIINTSDNLILYAYQSSTGPGAYYGAIDGSTLNPYTANTLIAGSVTTQGTYMGLTDLGDYTASFVFDLSSSAGTYFTAIKWADSAIVGVARVATIAGGPLSLNTAGVIGCNLLKGSTNKNFTGGAILGLTGVITVNALDVAPTTSAFGRTAINISVATSTPYTVPLGKYLKGSATCSSAINMTINGVSSGVFLPGGVYAAPIEANPGDVITGGGTPVLISGSLTAP